MRSRGVYHLTAVAAAFAFIANHNEATTSNAGLSLINPREGISALKKAMNGGRHGQSVKANARKAYRRRATKRARKLGHA
jgi:hypothetical protein